MSASTESQDSMARKAAFHLVLVTPYYWPIQCAATHLTQALAEGMAQEGHRVTVLTNASRRCRQPSVERPFCGARILRVWNPFLQRMGVLAKACEYLWFTGFFLLRGLFLWRVDLLFVSSNPPLAALPAALLAHLKGARLVYNLQDIFPESAVVAGLLAPGRWPYRLLRRAERATYRVSDLVTSISLSFSEHVQRLAPGTRVATIPNWVDIEAIRPMGEAEAPLIREFRQGYPFVVQYAGNIGFMQNLQVVIEAADRLRDYPDIGFVFIGNGNARQAMEALVRQRGLAHCVFLPLQPLERVPAVYNACDLGVVPLKPGAARIAVPSKTWNYLACGRPVLGCVEEDSPLAEAIRGAGAGSVVRPEAADCLAERILDYRNAPERVRLEGAKGRDYVESHLSLRAAIRSHVQMFDDLLGREAPGHGCIVEDRP